MSLKKEKIVIIKNYIFQFLFSLIVKSKFKFLKLYFKLMNK